MPHLQDLLSTRVSKSLEQIRAELYAHVEQVQDEYAAKGWLPQRLNLNKGVARGLLEIHAWGVWQLYKLLEAVLRQAFPRHATGRWLDVHGAQIGVNRKPATKTRGMAEFRRRAGSQGNIKIGAGKIVKTLPDGRGAIYRYVTVADVVMPEGADTISALVEAEDYGAASNAGPGQIRELATPIEGIESVDNGAAWITEEGADEETDAAAQRRYALSWEALAGVTAAKYKAVALGVKGVVDVAIADQHPRGEGTVDIIVKGAAGVPTGNLLEQVAAAIDAEIIINHDRLVKGPQPVPVAVSLTLELLHGDAQAIRQAVENRLRAVFSGLDPAIPGLAIGEDVIRDRLAAGIIAISGVKRIRWGGDLAQGDVPVPFDGLAVLGGLSIDCDWAASP